MQNRRVARDVMDFMVDVRQPSTVAYEDWDRLLPRGRARFMGPWALSRFGISP